MTNTNAIAAHPISANTTPVQSPRAPAASNVEQAATRAADATADTYEKIQNKIPSSEALAETAKQNAEAVQQKAETAAIETRSFLARAWDNISDAASKGSHQFLMFFNRIASEAYAAAGSIVSRVSAFFKRAEATAKSEASDVADVAQDAAEVVDAKIDDSQNTAEDVLNA